MSLILNFGFIEEKGMMISMKKLGVIVNPIAGMGGSVGLKGTDGMYEEAVRRGAISKSSERMAQALIQLNSLKNDTAIYTYSGEMGENVVKALGFKCILLDIENSKTANNKNIDKLTTKYDTMELAKKLKKEKVDLILFAGGDGTARDIFDSIGLDVVVLGIPCGVKMHSGVYAKTPAYGGELACKYLKSTCGHKMTEVVDIDENSYRCGKISTKLYGYLKVPFIREYVQNKKAPSPMSEENQIYSIAKEVVDSMLKDTYYIIGAGTTTKAIMDELGIKNTLIGVDLIYNKKLVANDIYGDKILNYIKGKKVRLIVTITGGQGFLFGRGNQQLTKPVLEEIGKENIIIIATKQKWRD